MCAPDCLPTDEMDDFLPVLSKVFGTISATPLE